MRLIVPPESELDTDTNLVVLSNLTFGPGSAVVLDGHRFLDCKFDRCTILYYGAPFQFRGNTQVAHVEWKPLGNAARAVNWVQNLCKMSPEIAAQILPDAFPPNPTSTHN